MKKKKVIRRSSGAKRRIYFGKEAHNAIVAFKEAETKDEKNKIYAVESPDDILLVVGGGDAGRFSACIPGWGSLHYCRSVTKPLNQATCDT